MTYISVMAIRRETSRACIGLLARSMAILEQNRRDESRMAKRAAEYHTYTAQQAKQLERVPGERDIRPAFTYGGLRRHKAKNWHEFHSSMAHFGEPGLANHETGALDMYGTWT